MSGVIKKISYRNSLMSGEIFSLLELLKYFTMNIFYLLINYAIP